MTLVIVIRRTMIIIYLRIRSMMTNASKMAPDAIDTGGEKRDASPPANQPKIL